MTGNKPWYKKHPVILVTLLVVCGLIILGFYNHAQSSPAVSQEAYAPSDTTEHDSLNSDQVNLERLKSRVQASHQAAVDTTSLDSQITAIISSNPDIIISVSIKDLESGVTYNYGDPNPLTAASVTKVLTAVDYMHQVELGQRSLEAILPDGNTAQHDIEQMIVVSDNDAWHVLNENLGYSQLQSYAESLGLTSYYYGDNTISASDVTKLLAGVYDRELINESHTQLLLSYMERANYRDLIIPAVPEYDTVYHKAGSLYANLNDATIITNSSKAIVLTIFTESLQTYSKSRVTSIMQQITTPTLQTFQLN